MSIRVFTLDSPPTAKSAWAMLWECSAYVAGGVKLADCSLSDVPETMIRYDPTGHAHTGSGSAALVLASLYKAAFDLNLIPVVWANLFSVEGNERSGQKYAALVMYRLDTSGATKTLEAGGSYWVKVALPKNLPASITNYRTVLGASDWCIEAAVCLGVRVETNTAFGLYSSFIHSESDGGGPAKLNWFACCKYDATDPPGVPDYIDVLVLYTYADCNFSGDYY